MYHSKVVKLNSMGLKLTNVLQYNSRHELIDDDSLFINRPLDPLRVIQKDFSS